MTGVTNLVQVIIAAAIPIAVLGILGNQLIRTVHWKDMLLVVGVSLLPATILLALRGLIDPLVAMGVVGIMTGHLVAFVDND